MRYSWIILLFFLSGCGIINPPADYYQKVQEMEEGGKQNNQNPVYHGETSGLPDNTDKTRVVKLPPQEPSEKVLVPKPPQDKEALAAKNETIQEPIKSEVTPDSLPRPEPETAKPIVSSSESKTSLESIAVSSDVIKLALENANLGISVRNVELVNGRLSGGKNSARISFLCESADQTRDRFVAICAVTYHLNKSSSTIDMVVAIAEDSQANLLGILQSNMVDITAWMTNKISRAEWFSRITKKTL